MHVVVLNSMACPSSRVPTLLLTEKLQDLPGPQKTFFTRSMQCQHGLVMRKVCHNAQRVHCDKTEERSVQIFVQYERSLSLVF